MNFRGGIAVWTVVLPLVGSTCPAVGGDDPSPDAEPTTASSPDVVAATVNGEPITLGSVNDAVQSVLQGRPVNPTALKQLQAEVLAQLIDRALIMQMLEKTGRTTSSQVVNQALEQVKKQAEEKQVNFAKMLADRKLTEEQFREQLAWQINWSKYLQSVLTDEALKAYFEAHRREFDGSELRVSHILLQADSVGSPAENERLKKMAEKLREQIIAGKIQFEEAARRYSAGPSRHKGGDLGFIPRHGLMLEPFAAATFKLSKQQLSEPVISPYGVHLIKVTADNPGQKVWSDVKEQLKGPAGQQVFEQLAAKERKSGRVTFTGKCPHFKPGTRELAEP